MCLHDVCVCEQVLSLHGCTKVSDEAVAAVALHGSLTSLNVNSIPGIGLSTIKALATATRYAHLGSLSHHMHIVGYLQGMLPGSI